MQKKQHSMSNDNPPPSFKPAIWAVLMHFSLIGVVYFGMTTKVEQAIEVELWDNAGTVAMDSPTTPATDETPAPSPQAVTNQAEKTPETPTVLEKNREANQAADINTSTQKPVNNPQPATKPQTNNQTTAKPEPTPTKPAPDTSRAQAATAAMMARMKAGTSNSNSTAGGSSNSDASAYIARVKQRVEAQSKLRIAGQTLNAVVTVRLTPSGDVIGRPSLQQSSGNAAWDADLMSAIARASPFPTPVHPEALKGIRLTFRH